MNAHYVSILAGATRLGVAYTTGIICLTASSLVSPAWSQPIFSYAATAQELSLSTASTALPESAAETEDRSEKYCDDFLRKSLLQLNGQVKVGDAWEKKESLGFCNLFTNTRRFFQEIETNWERSFGEKVNITRDDIIQRLDECEKPGVKCTEDEILGLKVLLCYSFNLVDTAAAAELRMKRIKEIVRTKSNDPIPPQPKPDGNIWKGDLTAYLGVLDGIIKSHCQDKSCGVDDGSCDDQLELESVTEDVALPQLE